MAQMSERTKPTYYRIVGETSKTVFAVAPASKVIAVRNKLQKQFSEKLNIELINDA